MRLMAVKANTSAPVLVADHDAETRLLVVHLFEQAGYMVVEAEGGDEALDAARRELPCLVILEVTLPRLSGYEVCHQLRAEFGERLPIVFLSGERKEPFDRVAGILLGADDYLVKPFAPDELLARARRLTRRPGPVAPAVASKLTAREMQVLTLLAEGHEQDEIASQLFISRRTVGTHIENLMRKLGVRTRTQAVALAYRDDLVHSSP
jgi:DNA-binding NarL/FixJ family response regulator